jgi:hypothetical protein
MAGQGEGFADEERGRGRWGQRAAASGSAVGPIKLASGALPCQAPSASSHVLDIRS